jgi:hypothetical protein
MNGARVGQERQHSRRRAYAKGLRLERLVQRDLEAQGAWVERAHKVVRYRPAKNGGAPEPFSVHHDILGLFDLLAVMPDGRRCFVQVTTLENVGHKRAKILAAGFPATVDDRILAHEGGRRFRELRGPDFVMPGRTLTLPALPRVASRGKAVVAQAVLGGLG